MSIAAIALATLVSQSCPSYADVEETLSGQAGEQPIIAAITSNGSALMFWLNPKSDTWTVTETLGECTFIRAYGEGVMLIPLGERV